MLSVLEGVVVGAGEEIGEVAGNSRTATHAVNNSVGNTRNRVALLRFLIGYTNRLTVCASPAPRSAAERRQVQARVSPHTAGTIFRRYLEVT